MASRRRFLAAAASAYCASAFGAYHISKRLRGGGDEGGAVVADEGDRSSASTFASLAPRYDRAIDTDETLMGLKLLRRLTLGGRGGARGDVLEACAGTGRNLGYYRRGAGVSSVTLAEPSREMLAEARQKAMRLSEGSGGGDLPRMNFVLARAEGLVRSGSGRVFGPDDAFDLRAGPSPAPPLPSPGSFAPRSFDTVVDTFGLCSVEDPKRALEEMAAACKPDGRIILIEHGRATTTSSSSSPSGSNSGSSPPSPFPFTRPWIDAKLDASAVEHRRRWGCWWNRDLEAVIRGVVDVESAARWHFGTTLVVVARPRIAERGSGEERGGRGDG